MPRRRNQVAPRTRLRPATRTALTALIIVAVAAALGFLAVHESKDPRFDAVISTIRGAQQTPVGAVVDAAAISPVQNAWLLDRRAVSRRIERLPWVKTARVSVRWPNRVRIDLTEREPTAVVVLATSYGEEAAPRYALVDDTQRILSLSPEREQAQTFPLILITPPPAGQLAPGDDLSNKDVAKALTALARLRALGLQVSQIAIAPATGISATADRHLRVLFGEDEDLARKAALFQAIVAKIAQPERVAYIDVRSVRAPTVLYR